MTAESLDQWNEEELRSTLEAYSLYTGVEYLSPTWARILLPRTQEDWSGPRMVTEEQAVTSLAFYVRFEDDLKTGGST